MIIIMIITINDPAYEMQPVGGTSPWYNCTQAAHMIYIYIYMYNA